ncbi:MAG: hypothetical protein LAQ69_37505 [Acidobacteriia bacterium]|nr:hypothetical protein [Terriglobia bacterium]
MKGFIQSVSAFAIIVLGSTGAAYSQTPVVAAGGVLNAASNDKAGQVAPGSLISIFGTDLASSLTVADSIPLSTSLSSVSVSINNIPAPLLFVSTGQINAQLPWQAVPVLPAGTNGTAQVVVTRNGVASAPVSFPVTAASPGIFSTQFGVGQAIAYGNSDGAYAAPVGAIPGATSHPAKINDPATLVILATGLGPVDTTVKDGDVPSVVTSKTLTTPTVLVGGVPAQVVFSGLVGRDASGKALGFVGVYQINIIIAPGTPTGNTVPLQIQMNGITSTDKVTIAVSN